MASNGTAEPAHRVLILGGGFAGVTVAKELERLAPRLRTPIEVTIVSKENCLLFVPLLPEAASGSIELTNILSPLRSLLPRTHVRVEIVQSVNLAAQTVTTLHVPTLDEHEIPWDHLVIALGNVVSLAGLPGVVEHGLPIRTIGDALQIRNRALEMLDAAETATDPAEHRRALTFVVAGGGFSGVEVAAELYDYLCEASRTCQMVNEADVRVVLLHSGDRILPELSADLAAFAQEKLAGRGVEIRLGVRLAAATATDVTLNSGERLDARTLIVAIGAGANPVLKELDLPVDRGRIIVDETLRVEGRDNIWALGDCAAVPLPDGQTAPPTAQFALREGRTVARNIAAALEGRSLEPFGFQGMGQMVSLGHHSAVAEVGRFKVAGLLAWILWRSFYLMRLPSFERKLRVWLDWNLDLLFRRDLAELNVQRTERLAEAHFETGQEIIRQGDHAETFYVITRGQVQVLRKQDGREVELAQLGPGESFGEVALLRNQRRNATVRALGPVDLIILGRNDFDRLAHAWGPLTTYLEGTASTRDAMNQSEADKRSG